MLRRVVHPIRRAIREELGPVLADELAANPLRRDDLSDRVRAALAAYSRRLRGVIESERTVRSLASIGGEVEKRHKKAFYGRLASEVGVNVLATEPFRDAMMADWVRSNTSLITSLAESTVTGLSEEIDAAFSSGVRHEELRRRWRERGIPVRFGTLEGRSKVIARDQVNKLNGQLTEHRQRNLGVTHYIWRTSGDERVRDRHVELDGQRFAWDSPPDEGHPGNAVQCRCVAEAVLDLDAIGRRAETFALQRAAAEQFGRAARGR